MLRAFVVALLASLPTAPLLADEGACCLGDICVMRSELDCATALGTWGGVGPGCSDTRCNEEPEGACCRPVPR